MVRLTAFIAACCFVLQVFASDVTIIDVRTADEYQSGHLSSSVNIPYDVIGEKIADLTVDKQTEIVLYCRSGRRSAVALEALQGLGYKNTSNIGGYESAKLWARAQEEN